MDILKNILLGILAATILFASAAIPAALIIFVNIWLGLAVVIIEVGIFWGLQAS